MTLLSAAERIAKLDRSAVKLNASRCLNATFNFAACEACFDICPVEAIHPGAPPELDEKACQDCLACLPVCPTGAFAADDAVHSLLNCASRLETKSIEILCAQNPNGRLAAARAEAAIQVKGCLAGLGAGTLLALLAMDLEKVILRLDACGECPWGKLEELIKTQVDQANHLAGGDSAEVGRIEWVGQDLAERSQEQPLYRAENPPLSRRGLFQMLGRQGQLAMARAMGEDGGRARRPGRNQRRVSAALEGLSAQGMVFSGLSLEAYPFAMLSVSEECTACGVCAHSCPTAALSLEVVKKTFRLRFSPKDCIGCEACLQLCAPQAIQINHNSSLSQVIDGEEERVLREGALAECRNCKTLFAVHEGEKYCPLCNYRRENPFGSAMPPGLQAMMERRKQVH